MSCETTISIGVKCPRCGYDLRGTIATWARQCPLTGTCAECGLKFEWRELLSAKFFIPRWCVEAVRGLRPFIGQAASTFVRSFWPWGFWSALRMSHPSRGGRIAAYLGLMLALGYVAFAVSHGLLVLSIWHKAAMHPMLTPSTSGWPVFLQAAILPCSDQSLGVVRVVNGFSWAYSTPLQTIRDYWLDRVPVLALVLAMPACCGLTFAALPVSRRLCRVQWSHIVRITVYAYALPLPAVLLMTFSLATSVIAGRGAILMATLATLTWLAFLPLQIIWWSVATSRFLKMPHAWGVGTAVVIVGILLPAAVAGVIWLATDPLGRV